MEYLLKSDVMAAIDWNRWAAEKLNNLPTFPAPSDASDGDLISRKALLERIENAYISQLSYDVVTAVIKGMPTISPAPSVDDVKPANLPEFPDSSLKLESGNNKLLEMIDGLYAKAQLGHNWGMVIPILREIARLLAERGDK